MQARLITFDKKAFIRAMELIAKDPTFRDRLEAHPVKTLEEIGIKLSPAARSVFEGKTLSQVAQFRDRGEELIVSPGVAPWVDALTEPYVDVVVSVVEEVAIGTLVVEACAPPPDCPPPDCPPPDCPPPDCPPPDCPPPDCPPPDCPPPDCPPPDCPPPDCPPPDCPPPDCPSDCSSAPAQQSGPSDTHARYGDKEIILKRMTREKAGKASKGRSKTRKKKT